MTLNIFSLTNLWSRSKQSDGKIGEVNNDCIFLTKSQSFSIENSFYYQIECIDINNESTASSNSFYTRSNDLYIGTTDG